MTSPADPGQAALPTPIHTWAPSAMASAVQPWAGTNSRAAVRMRCCSCSSLESSSSPPWSVYLRQTGGQSPHLLSPPPAEQRKMCPPETTGAVPPLSACWEDIYLRVSISVSANRAKTTSSLTSQRVTERKEPESKETRRDRKGHFSQNPGYPSL